ncbi:MAG TPA: sugar ABC transporter ATP-binding protein [Burkholderiaceae bacterium]|nr:sugar ABC transporter ATP-binding protein [Burkholderiaceae bacterium]
MNELVLRVEGLSKRYGAVRALDGVSLELHRHEVVGVIGANGAGKSTLLGVLAGRCRPDGGRIVLRGEALTLKSAAAAADAGIGMVFQEQSLLPNLSVAENILLGHEDAALRAGFYDWRALNALAAAQLAKLGSRIAPSARTDSLSFAERQVVELAKVLALEDRTRHAPVILLDEPTSMLDPGQVEVVLAQVERLRARASVLFVSHRLDEVLRVCDRVYVLSHGRCVAQRRREDCEPAELQRLMLGHELGAAGPVAAVRTPAPPAPARLSVRGLGRAHSYQAVSFELGAGEVLGIAGAEGSGRESLCRTLFGAEAPDRGEIVLDGQAVRLGGPADAVRLGIGYVPAERHAEGLVAGLSVLENMTLARLGDMRRGPFIDRVRERALVNRWIDRLRIKPGAPQTPVEQLSGGNQQKLVLAKWLIARDPKILILDRPLRGLDVGARGEIIHLIRELAARGVGILVVADTLDELAAMSDSVIVMRDGAVCGRFPACEAKPSDLEILERMV